MQNPEKFLERVLKFDGREIEQSILDNVNKIIDDPSKKYTEKDMLSQSFAASKLCAWSVNIVIFNKIFKKVRPLQEAKDKANEDLDKAMKELAVVKEQVRQLNEKVDKLK
jgi:dynein heavy chain